MAARSLFGVQPVGIKKDVSRPQAIKMPIIGIIICPKSPPNDWILVLIILTKLAIKSP